VVAPRRRAAVPWTVPIGTHSGFGDPYTRASRGGCSARSHAMDCRRRSATVPASPLGGGVVGPPRRPHRGAPYYGSRPCSPRRSGSAIAGGWKPRGNAGGVPPASAIAPNGPLAHPRVRRLNAPPPCGSTVRRSTGPASQLTGGNVEVHALELGPAPKIRGSHVRSRAGVRMLTLPAAGGPTVSHPPRSRTATGVARRSTEPK
jgi:hypothetical protein